MNIDITAYAPSIYLASTLLFAVWYSVFQKTNVGVREIAQQLNATGVPH
jgi:hypothetical protein